MTKLGDVLTISANKSTHISDKNWLLNLDMVQQQTGEILAYNYVTANELCGSIIGFDNNVVLYSKLRPNLNKVVLPDKYGFCTSELLPLLPDSKQLNREYLAWFLRSDSFVNWAVTKTAGAKMPRLGTKELLSKEIPLPDLPTQQRIADTLDKVSEGIEVCRKMLGELDLMVKAKFVEMFGTLPANELGWSTGTIRDCVTEVRYGSSRKAAEGDKGQYPYLRMNNITYDGELDLTDIKSIDIPDDELDKCSVRRGDVLFNRTNSRELVGKTCVYNRDELMVLAGFVVRVRANERMLPEFLSAFMNSTFTKRLLLSMCKTAIGQANINAQEFQNIEIYIPPITLQREFVDLKEQIDKSKLTVQRIRDKMEMEKLALMQEYFGREV